MLAAKTFVLVTLLAAGAVAQPPSSGGSSEACDACGASATYKEAITTTGTPLRTITSSGCPNHYSVCTGKPGVSACGDIGAEGTSTEAKVASKSIQIPANPVIAAATTDHKCTLGAIAIALNGVSIYGGAVDDKCDQLDTNDDMAEWTGFDMCTGHSERTGYYHYHHAPSCLIAQATATNPTTKNATGHSPQVGWAYDGFPIYGPLYTGGVAVTGLDACGGRKEEIPDLDSFKYRYYMPGATSNLYALPSNPKPDTSKDFPLRCYVGCTYDNLKDGKCTGEAGVTANYTATATTGYTAQFAASGPANGTNFKGETYTSSLIEGGVCKASSSSSGAIAALNYVAALALVLVAMW